MTLAHSAIALFISAVSGKFEILMTLYFKVLW